MEPSRLQRFGVDWGAVVKLQDSDCKFTNIQTIVIGQPSAPQPPKASSE